MLPFSIYLLFVVSYFLHFTSRFPVLGTIRFDLILMIMLFIFFLLSLGDIITKYKDAGIAKRLLIFICYFIITIPLVKWPGSVIKYGTEWYLKVVFFYFFTLAFVDTEKRLKIFLSVFLACQIFRGLEPAWLHYTLGYWGDVAFSHIGGSMSKLNRLSGSPHDIVNPNQLAWVIVNTFPFIFFLGWLGRGILSKVCCIVVSAGLLYSLMLTGSRSGLISLFAVLLGIVYFSKKRWRNLVVLCLLVVPVAIVITGLLSPGMAERYRSIYDSSAVGADTAHGRLQGCVRDLSTVLNPYGLLGYGLGTSHEVNVNYLGGSLNTHNLYIEILQEVGVLGFYLFMMYVFSIIKGMHSAKIYPTLCEASFLYRVISSLQVWVFMDLIYSMSCFGLSSWEWYLFGGVTTCTVRLVNENKHPLNTE